MRRKPIDVRPKQLCLFHSETFLHIKFGRIASRKPRVLLVGVR